MEQDYPVTAEEIGQRLDVFCVQRISGVSRASIQKAIKEGRIVVNGAVAKPRQLLKSNDLVHIQDMDSGAAPVPEVAIPDIPIIYEDRDILVVNKPAGVNVHPAPHSQVPTLTSWFLEHYPEGKDIGDDPMRPGIVHRLDKETSGVVVLAKTSTAFADIKKQFKDHRIKKEYLAWVFGVPGKEDGRITRPLSRSRSNPMRRVVDLEGKPAITEWKIEERVGERYALLRLYPFTGRTHQLRVHLHFLGHPIIGDKLYNFKRQKTPKGVTRHLLHAEKLMITLLSGEKQQFTAPLPEDFEIIRSLRYDPSRPA